MWFLIWDDVNERKIEEHGITKDEVVEVVNGANSTWDVSRSSGRSFAKGWTSTGRLIVVPVDEVDAVTLRPATAFEVED